MQMAYKSHVTKVTPNYSYNSIELIRILFISYIISLNLRNTFEFELTTFNRFLDFFPRRPTNFYPRFIHPQTTGVPQ